MYHDIVSQCAGTLRLVDAWLDKAEVHAADRKFDTGVLAWARLAPDMAPLAYQVTSACDYVKAGARLAGVSPPRHDDTEMTFPELRARVAKTLSFIEGVEAHTYEGASERKITLPWAPGKVLAAKDYVLQITIPNVYFHLAMIYAILRHNGVDLGKMDFLGALNFEKA